MQDEGSLEKVQASIAAAAAAGNSSEDQQRSTPSTMTSAAQDALRNIFVDVSTNDAAGADDEYSDEEEAQFHAQYKEKHFV